MEGFHVKVCSQANAEHAKTPRVFAHVGHVGSTICIADALRNLPENFIYGILLHELGHFSMGLTRPHSERDADRAGGDLAGVKIYRRSWGKMRNLEFVNATALRDVKHLIHRYTDYRPSPGEPWILSRR